MKIQRPASNCENKFTRLSLENGVLTIQRKAWGIRKQHVIKLDSICDYKLVQHTPFYRGLTLYTFDHEASLAEWKKVRKHAPINITSMNSREFTRLLEQLIEASEMNQQLGIRKQSWFYTSMSLSLYA